MKSLKSLFEVYFDIGVVVSVQHLESEIDKNLIETHFNSITSDRQFDWNNEA